MRHLTTGRNRRELATTRIRSLLTRLLFLAFVAAASPHPSLHAQNLCSATPPIYPCLDQPKENSKTVTGLLSASGVTVPANATVHIDVSGDSSGADQPVQANGKFSFTLPVNLNRFNKVTVTQTVAGAPAVLGAPNTGPVPVEAEEPGNICGKTITPSDVPCLNQPIEEDTQITGSYLDKPSAAITVLVDGEEQKSLSTTLEKGKFTVKNLNRLSQYDDVEVVQSSPQVNGAARQPHTGKVRVKAATGSPYNLKLTIKAASSPLDFGHQAMQTESAAKTVTINNSTDKAVDIVDPSTTITSTNYRLASNTCSNTLDATKGSCSLGVVFAPFTSRRAAGKVESDYIVLVPKNDQKALDLFNCLSGGLQTARKYLAKGHEQYDDFKGSKQSVKDTNDATNKIKSFAAEASSPNVSPSCTTQTETVDKVTSYASSANPNSPDIALQRLSDTETAWVQQLEQNFQVIAVSGVPDHWSYPLTRAVVGVDLSAPSAQAIKQAYFVDFDLLAPLPMPWLTRFKNEDPLENRLWLWFNPRITSLPQATNFSALSTINETGSFLTQESSKGTLGDIQGLDINGGFEFALVKPRDGIPWWAGYTNTQARLSPSLIVGGGMSTPFSTDNTDVVSQVNQSICDAFSILRTNPSATTSSQAGLLCMAGTPPSTSPVIVVAGTTPKSFVDFFTPERSRFFRKAYAGFRLKTYFFSKTIKGYCDPEPKRGENRGDCDGLYNIFPGIIDVTVGKDEAVTGGHMSTWLLRLEAVYPLPFAPSIHLFASTYTALKGNKASQPFNSFTINTPLAGANNDSNTFRFGLQPLDRDYFRVGVGVDLIQLFKKSSSGGQPSSAAPAAQPAAATPTT
jgi:hypothetical protein